MKEFYLLSETIGLYRIHGKRRFLLGSYAVFYGFCVARTTDGDKFESAKK